MSALVLGGSAIVPSLLLLWYIRARDRRPEPRGLVLKTFLWGAFICVPVVPTAGWLEGLGMQLLPGVGDGPLGKAFLGAAIPEEIFKFLVLRWYVWNKPAFDEPLDGVVYGATASLGFATLENILYVGEHGLGVAVLRAFTAVPGHAFTGVLMGAFIGRARFAEPSRQFGLLAAGLFWATLLHGAYDAFLFTGTGLAFLALGVLVIEVAWGRRLYKQLQAEQVDHMAQEAVVGERVEVVVTQSRMLPGGGYSASLAIGTAQVSSVVSTRPARPLSPQRTAWSWAKLALGGLGLSGCSLWWLALAAAFLMEGMKDVESVVGFTVVGVLSLVPTVLCFLLFRSGLRGPFEPVPVASAY